MFKMILASIVAVGFSSSVFANEATTPAATATATTTTTTTTTEEATTTDTGMMKKAEKAAQKVKPMIAKAKNNPHVKKGVKALNDNVNGTTTTTTTTPAPTETPAGTTGH